MDKLQLSAKEWTHVILSMVGSLLFIVFVFFKTHSLDMNSCIRGGLFFFCGAVFFFLTMGLDKGKYFYSKQTDLYRSTFSQKVFWIGSLNAIISCFIISIMLFTLAYLKSK